ncbi:MAG: molecular chaperone [Oscillospiraceae bacterium]|nr:molecular chaperone [Oscillospiraceae bacterium]
MKLTKYEKETIILTSEGDDTYSVYTFNAALKRRLADFAKKYPDLCRLESEDKKIGCQSYVIDKTRLSLRLTAPYSEDRKAATKLRAMKSGFGNHDNMRFNNEENK